MMVINLKGQAGIIFVQMQKLFLPVPLSLLTIYSCDKKI